MGGLLPYQAMDLPSSLLLQPIPTTVKNFHCRTRGQIYQSLAPLALCRARYSTTLDAYCTARIPPSLVIYMIVCCISLCESKRMLTNYIRICSMSLFVKEDGSQPF